MMRRITRVGGKVVVVNAFINLLDCRPHFKQVEIAPVPEASVKKASIQPDHYLCSRCDPSANRPIVIWEADSGCGKYARTAELNRYYIKPKN